MTRTPPHDLQAEESLLGACLLNADMIPLAAAIVAPEDFYKQAHQHVFSTLVAAWSEGERPDPATVAARLRRAKLLDAIGGPTVLVSLQAGTPSTSNAPRYARIVADHSTLRRMIGAAGEIAELGYGLPLDVGAALDDARGRLAAIDLPEAATPSDLWGLDDFLDRPESERAPWVLPGLMRRDWRVVIVAPEGVGKSVLARQIAMLAAQGRHPLAFTPTEKVRTLIVDLENPDEAIVDQCEPLRAHLSKQIGYEPGASFLWHRPGGINLRNRSDRAALDAVLGHARPDLVCLGPLYKAYRRKAGEDHEQATEETQQILDDFRTRHGCALFLEHHAPKKQGGVRDIEPFGSSLWLRWPELGIGLLPEDTTNRVLKLKRWRGDRLPNSWPAQLVRGREFPWEGVWDDDTWTRGAA